MDSNDEEILKLTKVSIEGDGRIRDFWASGRVLVVMSGNRMFSCG